MDAITVVQALGLMLLGAIVLGLVALILMGVSYVAVAWWTAIEERLP